MIEYEYLINKLKIENSLIYLNGLNYVTWTEAYFFYVHSNEETQQLLDLFLINGLIGELNKVSLGENREVEYMTSFVVSNCVDSLFLIESFSKKKELILKVTKKLKKYD